MKKILFTLIALIFILSAKAQTPQPDVSELDKADSATTNGRVNEKPPSFPGGLDAFGRFLSKNIYYPRNDREHNIQGRVLVSFIVEKDGTLTDFKVAHSVSYRIDEEALRVMKKSPKWLPGMQNGQPVRVLYIVPISFNLATIVVRFNGAQYPHKADSVNGKITTPKYVDMTIDEPISVTTPIIDSNKIFTSFETAPSFVGGTPQFNIYIKQNVKWPPNFKKVNGRVLLNFVVEKDGTITNISIIARGLVSSPEMDAEAIRLLKNSPKWKPGTLGGRPVRVAYTIPIYFDEGN